MPKPPFVALLGLLGLTACVGGNSDLQNAAIGGAGGAAAGEVISDDPLAGAAIGAAGGALADDI